MSDAAEQGSGHSGIPENAMEHTVLSDKPSHIAIVGGGFSGVCAAVQLVRSSPAPLHITLIEPRDRVGLGLAYSTTDPDHRLNGPTWVHSIDPQDSGHFTRWCEKQGIFSADSQALLPDGSAFVRRADFGRYMESAFREHAQWPATQSTITHLRARAVDALEQGDSVELVTDAGHSVVCDLLIIATGNPQPRLQAPLDASLAAHPGVVENPLDTQRLLEIPAQASVLIIGSSLTALDVLATLVRQGHTGKMVSISRRGLQPRPQAPSAGPLSPPPTVPVAPQRPRAARCWIESWGRRRTFSRNRGLSPRCEPGSERFGSVLGRSRRRAQAGTWPLMSCATWCGGPGPCCPQRKNDDFSRKRGPGTTCTAFARRHRRKAWCRLRRRRVASSSGWIEFSQWLRLKQAARCGFVLRPDRAMPSGAKRSRSSSIARAWTFWRGFHRIHFCLP